MDFLKLIQSLDELLYEVMSWLLFYPLTLWRVIKAPLSTMRRAERELVEDDDVQYDDLLPPPLFLLLTLILIHVIELGMVGKADLADTNFGLGRLIDNDTNLIIFRVLIVALLPLAAARALIKARGGRLDKHVLKSPFYAQCYAASAFALVAQVAQFVAKLDLELGEEGYYALTVVAGAWLLAVETGWFANKLEEPLWRGFGRALLMILQWSVIATLLGTLLD